MCLEDNILYVTYESRYIILPPFPGNPLRVHFSKYTGPCGKASTAEAKLGVLCRVSGWKKWQVIGEGPRRGAWLQVFGQIFWEEKTIEKTPHGRMLKTWNWIGSCEVEFFFWFFWGRAMGWISWHQAVTLTQFFGGFTDHSALALAVLPWGNLLIPNHLAWLSSLFTLGWWQYLASPASKRLHLSRTSTIF